MPATLSASQQLPLRLCACFGAENYTSLEVNYLDIANTMPVVAIWLADHPREMLPILSETAMCAGCPALGQPVLSMPSSSILHHAFQPPLC